MSFVAPLALALMLTACGGASSSPTVVGRFTEPPDRASCEPTPDSFTLDVDGTETSDDAAFLAGAAEYDIPGATVVAHEEDESSTLYHSYSDGELKAISQAIRTPVNGLWAVGGVRYCG